MLGVEKKQRNVAFIVGDQIRKALVRKVEEERENLSHLEEALEKGKVSVDTLNRIFGAEALELCEKAEVVHSHFKEDLAPESKVILEKDIWKEEIEEPFNKDLLASQVQVTHLLYGVFAVFGTGAAVYLAFSLFSDWNVEWRMIAAILAATLISISELIYFIKNVC